MIVRTYKYNRESLNENQKDFLIKLAPLARMMQEWTRLKSGFNNVVSPTGLNASIIMADVILLSTWGEHPIAKPERNGKYSNNLSLMEIKPGWKGKSILYGTRTYKSFKDWSDWGVDYTDDICFSGTQELTLRCTSEQGQIDGYTIYHEDYTNYRKMLRHTIEKYYLSEFNLI